MIGTRHLWLLMSLNVGSSFEGHAGNTRFQKQEQKEDYIIDFIMITHGNDNTVSLVGSVKDNFMCFFFAILYMAPRKLEITYVIHVVFLLENATLKAGGLFKPNSGCACLELYCH